MYTWCLGMPLVIMILVLPNETQLWFNSDTLCGNFIKQITQWALNTKGRNYPCDLIAVATAINPTVVLSQEVSTVRIETQGRFSRGLCFIEKDPWGQNRVNECNNAMVITKVDFSQIMEMAVNSTKNS